MLPLLVVACRRELFSQRGVLGSYGFEFSPGLHVFPLRRAYVSLNPLLVQPHKLAEWQCYMRASERCLAAELRVIDDPYAEAFLEPMSAGSLKGIVAAGVPGDPLFPRVTGYVVRRHRWFDEQLLAALSGGFEQVVFLDCGYNTRSFRLAPQLAGCVCLELAHPWIAPRKAVVATDQGWPVDVATVVSCALGEDDLQATLQAAGLDEGRPAVVIWENSAMYLGRALVRATLDVLAASLAPGSLLLTDLWFLSEDPGFLPLKGTPPAATLLFIDRNVRLSVHPEDAASLLAPSGFELVETKTSTQLAALYQPQRVSEPLYPAGYALSAIKRA